LLTVRIGIKQLATVTCDGHTLNDAMSEAIAELRTAARACSIASLDEFRIEESFECIIGHPFSFDDLPVLHKGDLEYLDILVRGLFGVHIFLISYFLGFVLFIEEPFYQEVRRARPKTSPLLEFDVARYDQSSSAGSEPLPLSQA
jgi:hypothetical protein